MAWVSELYEGMKSCLAKHGGIIVGGETTSLPAGTPTMISVAGRGVVARSQVVTRSGGRPGDAIYVTGALGRLDPGEASGFYAPACGSKLADATL